MRLNKYISSTGFCSRRKADEWIAAGRVTVNGIVADMGMQVEAQDEVCVGGKKLTMVNECRIVAFYKPKGYAVTAHRGDKSGIFNNFPLSPDLRYIGRLDKDSDGLLLLTNDGNLCNEISKAKNRHEKEYIVTVNREITEDFVKRMEGGVRIFDANKNRYVVTRRCMVSPVSERTFSIVLTEGHNRQIRRMCEYFDYKVVKLTRVRVMNITLSDMQPGQIREVTEEEERTLRDLIEKNKGI